VRSPASRRTDGSAARLPAGPLPQSIAAIERLQRIYGYYLDNRMWEETLGLFTDDGEIEIGRRGIYRGREPLRTFVFDVLGRGRSGRARNELHNHIQR
jgi:hypothetical protein